MHPTLHPGRHHILERRRIVELARTGTAEVLITLVRAEGSSYRRPGARILLAANGTYAGTISGGCLEAEVTRKALWLTRSGPIVERYSTLFDDTADIPFGLGCGGTVDLLYERVDTPEAAALLHALAASLMGTPATVLTWLPTPTQPLQRAILSPSGTLLFRTPTLSDPDLNYALANPQDPALHHEHLATPQRLILLGAGDDARPVASIAAHLGWTVQVADGRAQLARPERFPEAQSVHPAPANLLQTLLSTDAVVLMTHSYEQDRDLLAALLAAPAPPAYIGILGARHRTSLLVAEAAALTGQSIDTCCQRIHAPVGLDLGGDGPEAIALAIVAEIQAFTQGKLPASRRLTAAAVTLNLRQAGTSRYLQAECALGQSS